MPYTMKPYQLPPQSISFKKLPVVTIGLVLLFTLLSACKNEETPSNCGENWNFNVEIRSEAQALNTASVAFSQDPTVANCLDFREAGNDYIDKAEELKPCAEEAGQLDICQEAIDSVQASLDELQEC